MRSDALPPARNEQTTRIARRFEVGFFALVFFLPCLTACTAANSAVTSNSKTPFAQPRTPAQRTARTGQLKLSANLPPAEVGKAYNGALSVTGAKGALVYSISWGSLPNGLALNPATGGISGKPSKSGTAQFGIHVVDSRGLGTAQPLQIPVSDAPANVSIALTPNSGTLQSSGSLQFTAVVSNTANVGVTWTASAGTISSSGMYKAPAVNADTPVAVKATSIADPTKSGAASLMVTPAAQTTPVTITTTGLTGITSGVVYSANLKASGGTTPYVWSLKSGSLPSGISLQSSGNISGTTKQTGQFSFTVQVSDSSSPKQTATESLSVSVSAVGGNGKTVPLSFFNAGFNGGRVWPPTDGQNQTATLAGIRLWDDGIKWGQLNTSNGVYNWGGLDNWLERAQAQHLDVLYTFGDTPQFAAAPVAPSGCNTPGPYSCAPPTDVNPDGTGTDAHFQAFVTALVTHAAGRIAYYELWNEPDCKCFWSGTTAQLVRMGKDAAAIIRSLDPNAKILSPSAHGPTMATWFDGYVAAGGAANFDIINVHMRGWYGTNGSPEAFMTVWGQVTSEIQKRNLTNLPIWDDEYGILPNQGVTDPDMLAGYVVRSAMLRAGVGIQRQYIYTWDSHAPYGLQGSPSGVAWNQVATWLIGHSVSPCTATGTVYTCALDNGLVVWDTAKSCNNGVCSTSNFTYPAGYTWYHDLDGNRSALTGKTVQIGYKPILLDNQ
jgi:polysaccharide biosynthesis protein PslG